jgi:hypothetical protein
MDSYVVRDSSRRAIGPAVASIASAIVPTLIVVLIWSARHGLSAVPLVFVLLSITALSMTVLAVGLVAFGVGRLVRGLRRPVIVAVDRDGILLGRAMLEGPRRFVPWHQVRALTFYTTCWRSGTSEDPPLIYAGWLQVDLTDGTADRRSEPDGRAPWGDLVTAVERVAPAMPVEFLGTLPEGTDPYLNR